MQKTARCLLILGVVPFLALVSGNALSADVSCDAICQRDQIELTSSIAKVNEDLNQVEAITVGRSAADNELVAASFQAAARTVRNARRSDRLDGLYSQWEEYLNAQAQCVAARAAHLHAWEKNGGWSGFAADMFNVVKLFSLTVKGTSMSTVSAERCNVSREALSSMKSLGTSHLIASKRFVTEVRGDGPLEMATAFRLVE